MTTVRSCDHTSCHRAATIRVEFSGCHGFYCAEHADLVNKTYHVMWARPLTAQEKNTPHHRHRDVA